MCTTWKTLFVASANSVGATLYPCGSALKGLGARTVLRVNNRSISRIIGGPDPAWRLVSVILLAVCLGLFAAPAQAADGRFNGKWRVSIEYSRISSSDPRCQGHLLPDPMIISNGKISGIINHVRWGACFLKGSVTPNGELKNAKCESGTTYSMKGQMGRDVANGTWKDADSDQCDGTWAAKKIK